VWPKSKGNAWISVVHSIKQQFHKCGPKQVKNRGHSKDFNPRF